ncbi:DUF6099 family protein [Streptomyces sp. NPDC059740]|uniref:DUF6099 family protein n=1 Tax=Streptomyces sp. NPDC059740 TaxID=3346926 RepID=UPI003661DF3D
MDAVRIIAAGRRGLTQARTVQDIVVEAWQAQAVAEAIGSHLAVSGPREVRSQARGLRDAGGRSGGALLWRASYSGGLRAAGLTEVGDARAALSELLALLGDLCEALVVVACEADEEVVYWSCVEAMDVADESRDRVMGILRQLGVKEAGMA